MSEKPIKNLRVTFWGTQGSCQYFPSPQEVADYSQMISLDVLTRVLKDVQRGGFESVEELVGGELSPQTLTSYLQKLGRIDPPVYGGETSCISIETSEGNILILDAGSGLRHFAQCVVERCRTTANPKVHLFGSHEHLDHRIGFPFADFCFARSNPWEVAVYGNYGFLAAIEERLGIFSHVCDERTFRDDPINYKMMAAKFRGVELREADARPPCDNCPWEVHDQSKPIVLGSTVVRPFSVYHGPTPCLGFRVEHNGVSFVYCTDHEFRHGSDDADPRQAASEQAERRVREYSANVDAAYYDGQYFLDEYFGLRRVGKSTATPRIDWGHSCIEDVIERVRAAGMSRAYVGHHDPFREWQHRVEIDQWLAKQSAELGIPIELAKDRQVIDL